MNIARASGGALLSFVFLFLFVYLIFGMQCFFDSSLIRQQNEEVMLGSVSNAIETQNAPVAAPQINAEAAISVETDLAAGNKVLFEKSSDIKLPIASLTKLMSAAVVLDNYDLMQKIIVSKTADMQAPMKQDVKAGDTLPVFSFLEIMLIKSSNKSAYALAEEMGVPKFVGLMNRKAGEIGLSGTYFADSTGLSPQNISTAEDLTKLAKYILKNYPQITIISGEKEINIEGFGKVENTDQLLGEVPEVVCGKTGFTTEAKGCLLLIMKNPKNNNYFINVVLGAEDRFLEMKKIIDYINASCK